MNLQSSIDIRKLDAAIFDMDGVVTRTATVHATAWKKLFDDFLAGYGTGSLQKPFDIDSDYRKYVDGKPRNEGVADFLASRNIELPWGDRGDSPDTPTVSGLGNKKDAYFWEIVRQQGVRTFESTVEFVNRLRNLGLKTGVFSASRNAEAILSTAGVLSLFYAKVDGRDAEVLGIAGKPRPDMLLHLVAKLDTPPERSAVFEDAIAGVQAARAGNFGLIVGINRSPDHGRLLQNGADIEVNDLSEARLVTPTSAE